MIYITNNNNDPRYNLAFEEYVFRKMNFDEPVLLLWQNGPAVIVGKYQNTIEEINYDYIRENNIQVVRRNTGGGAVYHDLGNLNYSFIIPNAGTKVDFKTFTIPVVKALRSRGIDAVQTGRNDILVDEKKFSGNAQQFSNRKLLHHGTLMFDVDTDKVSKTLNAKAGKFKSKSTKSVRSRVINLKQFFTGETVDDFKELLLEWFDKEYKLKEIELTSEQLGEVEALMKEKYSRDEWNFGSSPNADIVRGDFFKCGHVEFHFQIVKHKIKKVTIMGDFFASKDIVKLESSLEGVEYERLKLLEILKQMDLESYLGEISAEELVDVIV